MKEIEQNKKDSIEISVKQKKQQSYNLVDRIQPYNNHTIYKINKETLEIEKAKFLNTAYIVGGENKKEIMIIDGFAYVAALNMKNALRKFKLGKNGTKEIDSNPMTL